MSWLMWCSRPGHRPCGAAVGHSDGGSYPGLPSHHAGSGQRLRQQRICGAVCVATGSPLTSLAKPLTQNPKSEPQIRLRNRLCDGPLEEARRTDRMAVTKQLQLTRAILTTKECSPLKSPGIAGEFDGVPDGI